MDFKEYKRCQFDDITEYVEKEKPEYLPTLEKQVEDKVDYLTIKKDFYKAYFPELIPEQHKQPNKMANWLEERKKKETKKK